MRFIAIGSLLMGNMKKRSHIPPLQVLRVLVRALLKRKRVSTRQKTQLKPKNTTLMKKLTQPEVIN